FPPRSSPLLLSRIIGEGKQLVTVVDEQHAVRRHRRRIDGAAHVHLRQDFLLFSRLENRDVTVLITQIHSAVDDERRPPYGGEHVVLPVFLAGGRVETVQES